MTRTVQHLREAVESYPCRICPSCYSHDSLTKLQPSITLSRNTNLQAANAETWKEFIAPEIEKKPILKSVSTQTYSNTKLWTDNIKLEDYSDSSVIFDGLIQSSIDVLDDITDITKDIARLTRDAAKLFAKMPVGTNFENSALKTCFSLSSLPPSTGLEHPDHAKMKTERQYNSLTKKRKDPKQEHWRKSWGSNYDNKDDFWSAIQANYDYIMDNNLIDKCQEIDRDICSHKEESWSLNHLIGQFSDLCSFLNDIQDAVYGKTENVTNWSLRASYIEEMKRVSPRHQFFNENANKLIEVPALKNEVTWRVSHLNSKWKQVENSLRSSGCSRCGQESCPDVEHEVRCLRKWVKEMESRLQPLNFQVEWTLPELEKKALEHMVLQRDIENHSKIVSSVIKLCNLNTPRDVKCHASNARRVANGLERRYHLLFLRSLEWQCHIESLFKLHNNKYQDLSSDADSDEEPCMKQPRLSSDYTACNNLTNYDDDEVDGTSLSDPGMDIGSESVYVAKMVRNGNEQEPQHFELSGCIGDNQKIGHSVGSCFNENLNSNKDNTLQKIPVAVDVSKNSNTKMANVGSYYFKHRDTDSEIDTGESLKSVLSEKVEKTKDESSEDEFTYSTGPIQPQVVTPEICSHSNDKLNKELVPTGKDSIQLLVQKVEELVSSPTVDPLMFHSEQQKSKLSRVKEWLNFENNKPIDSCDASGECTTSESEEDKESQSSEDLNDSVITCRPKTLNHSALPLNNSHISMTSEIFNDTFSSPDSCKINLRPKRLQMKGNRPWSVSCLSQLSRISPTKNNNNSLPNFSISESALNKLAVLSPTSVKTKSFTDSANSIGIQGNNSTSSTVEESCAMFLNEGLKAVSAKKKKFRLRRKHFGLKNESGSESQSYKSAYRTEPLPSSSKLHVCTLIKSGSFSGSGSKMINQERSTASDPSVRSHDRNNKVICDTSTTSEADSEDEKKMQRLPQFLLEPHAGMVKEYCTLATTLDCRDSSPEKSSLNTAEEHSSSLSEQAWDNYQEKYLSENYSEAHDSDAARRLLEFGEDYRCYLDSQSDCWSAHSYNHEYSPHFKRKSQPVPYADSDAEIEDIKQHINESKAQLKYTLEIYEKHVAMGLDEFLLSSDCGEIIATCERHIYALEVVIDTNDDAKVLPDIEVMEVKALMCGWMDLKWSAKKMQNSRILYNEVIAFKNELLHIVVIPNRSSVEVKSKEELIAEIDRLTEVQALLQEKKRRLLELNVAVHRYILSEDTPYHTNLKSEVSELYTLWNDTCQSLNERLNNLNTHLQIWTQLECRLDELQSDLRNDEETLHLLDMALNGGVVSMEVASSVRDVAKVLSESQRGVQKNVVSGENASDAAFNRSLSLSLLTEGSFSDSGISDEGSEQELSEREHRLAAIRRLVRQLEAIMAPDSESRIKMTQRLEQAESELKKLQNRCRGLIVRTAVCAELQSRGAHIQNDIKLTGNKKHGSDALDKDQLKIQCMPSDPDNDPDNNGSWFWRIVRASMPFQVALVALICMACLLEPSCCDSINNLNLSLTPQLRYVRGPPPV